MSLIIRNIYLILIRLRKEFISGWKVFILNEIKYIFFIMKQLVVKIFDSGFDFFILKNFKYFFAKSFWVPGFIRCKFHDKFIIENS